eukprot:807702-Amphidinium_carterae.1
MPLMPDFGNDNSGTDFRSLISNCMKPDRSGKALLCTKGFGVSRVYSNEDLRAFGLWHSACPTGPRGACQTRYARPFSDSGCRLPT